MPRGDDPLSAEQVAVIGRWISDGAPWPEGVRLGQKETWWSVVPLEQPTVPRLSAEESAVTITPIDAFVIARHREKKLSFAAPADRLTLVRRIYFDLLGLPPTPAEVAEFLSDDNDQAYEKLVDRLLASPAYGERWARHWLDVVHYADSHGYDKDKPRPNAWPYRDYVIRALNVDKPYARFVQEQVAGDVLYPSTVDGIVATGFIAAGPWDFIGHAEVPESKIDGQIARHLDRDDMVATTLNTFVSTTVQCAQCHDHKFDPITQEDYYGLQAVFAALDRADRPYDLDPKIAQKRARLLSHKRDLLRHKAQATNDGSEKLEQGLAEINAALQQLPEPQVVYGGTIHGMDLKKKRAFSGTGARGGIPRPIHVLARGDVLVPGKPAVPGTVRLISSLPSRFELLDDHLEGDRRKALAAWLVSPQNALTWRSIVNRIWQYHMGRGLVDSPSDFGRMGRQPSHPLLLDWLAAEFRDSEQSIKALHRLILLSAVYRQSTVGDPAHAKIDGSNEFLWRMNRRRLEAESVRDAVLAASGKLDARLGGPGFQTFVIENPQHSPHYQYHKHDPDDPKSHRRSVYRFIVRSQVDPFMETLDCADPSLMVDKRSETISAVQALALLNDRFMLRMCEHFAVRLETLADSLAERIELAYQLTIGRTPSDEEREVILEYAAKHGLANTCRVIFNLNQFLFVD